MEEKRSGVPGYKMVRIDKILTTDKNVSIHESLKQTKIKNLIQKFGPFKIIVVCEVGEKYRIVDGSKAFQVYVDLKQEKVLCYNLGELSQIQELSIRLLLNTSFNRLDYLEIAKAISDTCTNYQEASQLSNLTGMTITDVERYQKLLLFDWDEFLNKPIDSNQINLFDNEL
jgi:hypothetical protein